MSVMMMGASTGCNTVYGSTPALQSPPLPLDEFALPGRRHDLVADGGVGDPQPRPPLGGAGAPGRRAPRPRRGGRLRGRVFHAHPPGRRAHDRAGDPRAAQGLGDRRRRRPGGHRIPERLEGDPSEPAEREDADARHPGVFEHGRPELRLLDHARAATT